MSLQCLSQGGSFPIKSVSIKASLHFSGYKNKTFWAEGRYAILPCEPSQEFQVNPDTLQDI